MFTLVALSVKLFSYDFVKEMIDLFAKLISFNTGVAYEKQAHRKTKGYFVEVRHERSR